MITRLARGVLLALALAAFSHGGNASEAIPILPPPQITTVKVVQPIPQDYKKPPRLEKKLVENPADFVDLFRITTDEIWHVGNGTVQGVVEKENDALVLTRVAMGENPSNLQERIYIMWFIRLRAELGYKNAGHRGWVQPEDRWWHEPTTIKEEALCIGGCQFTPVRMWQNIYFPANVKEGQLTAMIYPTENQMQDFYLTYKAALQITHAPITEYPEELRGYDEFRAGSTAKEGIRYQQGGLSSKAFFKETEYNIFRDVSPWDNTFWENIKRSSNEEVTNINRFDSRMRTIDPISNSGTTTDPGTATDSYATGNSHPVPNIYTAVIDAIFNAD